MQERDIMPCPIVNRDSSCLHFGNKRLWKGDGPTARLYAVHCAVFRSERLQRAQRCHESGADRAPTYTVVSSKSQVHKQVHLCDPFLANSQNELKAEIAHGLNRKSYKSSRIMASSQDTKSIKKLKGKKLACEGGGIGSSCCS